ELRTPLNAIIGYTDMILDGIDEFDRESIGNDLHTVRKSAENLLEIVNDILDLSKIEAGKMDVRVETFPVGELLEELAKTTTPLAMRQRNTFKLTYSRLLGKIKTDRGKLRQILLNLLANACKFTHKGRIELRVDLKMESGTPWFVFTVSDSGIGIAREKVDRLFAPFTQADESSTRKYGGTGLGLALVRHFTEMLGGVISVESELGAGSSFKVKLPRELADPQVEGALMISVH
ncbi:MAG: HAMP domain-containing histidine kinase, partial [Myxococcales bacterium]|nr:HAMP domain-containing histidine kinase [Myxococcales bacterium]